MKSFILTLLLLLAFTGCDNSMRCNVQICEDGIMKFNACRSHKAIILLDDNKQTIKCKGSQ